MESSITICSIASCIILYGIFNIVIQLMRWVRLYKYACKFDGPPALPFIGNAHLFLGDTEAIFKKMIELIKLYPSPFRIWLGSRLIFVVSTPEQLKIVYNSNKTISRGDFLDPARAFAGTGLILADEEKWRLHRPLIQPTFHLKNLQAFMKVFSTQSIMMIEQMKQHLDGSAFKIYDYLSMYSLNTSCETTMGVSLGGQKEGKILHQKTEKVMTAVCKRIFSPWLQPDFIFYRTQLGRDQQNDVNYLHGFTDDAILARKKLLLARSSQRGVAEVEYDKCNLGSRKKVLLDNLIELSRHNKTLQTEKALREEIDNMLVAGYETTANVSTFVMLMLAAHPEVQEEVYRELCEIYGENDIEERSVTPEDLSHMKYMERVIQETMRLFTVVPFHVRVVRDDLNIGELILPRGSSLVLATVGLHNNENYWPNPTKFDPDRFLPDEVAKREPYAFSPFGAGLRSCIGSKYAMMSMKTVVAAILRRYVVMKDDNQPAENIRLKMEVVAKPVHPILLRIQKRTRTNACI